MLNKNVLEPKQNQKRLKFPHCLMVFLEKKFISVKDNKKLMEGFRIENFESKGYSTIFVIVLSLFFKFKVVLEYKIPAFVPSAHIEPCNEICMMEISIFRKSQLLYFWEKWAGPFGCKLALTTWTFIYPITIPFLSLV